VFAFGLLLLVQWGFDWDLGLIGDLEVFGFWD
jgi:hypothetical protein